MNNEINGGLELEISTEDLIGRMDLDYDLVLAGDMFYDTELGAAVHSWLAGLVDGGGRVLVGDPGRHALPRSLDLLAKYDMPPWLRKTNNGFTTACVYELSSKKK